MTQILSKLTQNYKLFYEFSHSHTIAAKDPFKKIFQY